MVIRPRYVLNILGLFVFCVATDVWDRDSGIRKEKLAREALMKRFEYLSNEFPKELRIANVTGVIHPNETVYHDWIFAPTQLRNYEFDISCRLNVEIGSRTFVMQIEVSGNSTEGSLITIPEELSFGDRTFNEPFKTGLKAFNFSPVPIHFLLICRPTRCLEIMNHPENDVAITPQRGTINPGKGEKIQVTVTPKQSGFYELTVEYFIRPSSLANSTIPLSKPKHLCVLNGMCYLPTLQVQDLIYKSETNQGVSKVLLWESLVIDGFNSTLKDILPSQEILIEMAIPLIALKENEKFFIKLLVTNSNPIKASWFLKKKKTCLCNDNIIKNREFLKVNRNNDCPYCVYDEACDIKPKQIDLKTNETGYLTIEIKNHTSHTSGIFWELDVGQERKIILNISLKRPIILPGPNLKFENVTIGECPDVYYQTIWLNNTTECESNYAVETKNLALFNKRNYGIIFTCLNPEGTIPKFNCNPVLFGFCPNKFGKFQTKVAIKVGDNETTLNLEGESTCSYMQTTAGQERCPFSDSFTTPEVVVYFSSDCIVVSPLLTHGKVVKMIMMHNRHQQDVLSYEWKSYEIPGVIKVNVEPSKGLIQPYSLLTVLIEIVVGSYECLLDINIYCNFVNVSERRLAEKKKMEQENILKQLEGQFTINEKGVNLLKKPAFEEIKNPLTFCKALTLQVRTYDSRYTDERVNLQKQLKNIPIEEFQNKVALNRTGTSKVISMSSQIFECLIWEIVNSKHFQYLLNTDLNGVHNLKYSHFPENIAERKYYTKRNNWKLSKKHAENILHTMLCMVIHEEFNFDTIHFSHPPDARQISYQKTYLEAYTKQIVNESVLQI